MKKGDWWLGCGVMLWRQCANKREFGGRVTRGVELMRRADAGTAGGECYSNTGLFAAPKMLYIIPSLLCVCNRLLLVQHRPLGPVS